MLGFQAERRINESLLLRNWPRNTFAIKDDEYETLVLTCNRVLDSLMLASYITRSLEENESSPSHTKDVVIDLEKEIENVLLPF